MRYDARKERWMSMEIRDVKVDFNDVGFDRSTVPIEKYKEKKKQNIK